jgi:peptidoglycan-N-acetylglucosamine deacetylase
MREAFLAAQRQSMEGWSDELASQATLPGIPALAGKRPRRGWSRRWLIGGIAGALALVVVATSTLLALADPSLLSFAFGPSSASVLSSSTATLAPTPTATPAATATATAIPTATQNPLVTGGINLGCGSAPLHPASWVVRGGTAAYHEVAITFDDGPSMDYTASILSTLEQTHTPATFFVVGSNVAARPYLVQREAGDGFTIGIHTYDHPFMTKLTPVQRAWELSATADAIHKALGASYCLPYWRPPFGDYNSDVFNQTQVMGLTSVTWNVDPQDWSSPGVSVIVQRVLSAAQPGSIILLHDGYMFRQETAEALPQIIQGLRARGLVPVTLAQLLSGAPPPATPTPTIVPPTATATATATATDTPIPTPTATP